MKYRFAFCVLILVMSHLFSGMVGMDIQGFLHYANGAVMAMLVMYTFSGVGRG